MAEFPGNRIGPLVVLDADPDDQRQHKQGNQRDDHEQVIVKPVQTLHDSRRGSLKIYSAFLRYSGVSCSAERKDRKKSDEKTHNPTPW